MSHRIEFSSVFIKVPRAHVPEAFQGKSTHIFNDFSIWATCGGANNEIGHDNKVVRSWSVDAFAQDSCLMEQVVAISAYCEGGSLKLRGKDTSPENYIAYQRKRLKAPVAEYSHKTRYWLQEAGFNINTGFYVNLDLANDMDVHQASTLNQALAAGFHRSEAPSSSAKGDWVFFDCGKLAADMEKFAFFLAYHHLDDGPAWRKMRISGPA
jgi:hypothetical protein